MRRPLLLAAVLSSVLAGQAAHAQSNPFGDLIGGVLRGATQENARNKAKADWSHVDPTILDCLNKSISPPPTQLAAQGIGPGDPRVQTYVSRCQQQIAADKQKEQAQIRERQRQEELAQREQKARAEARQKQEEAEQKAKAELEALRTDPEIKSLLADDTVTLLIASKENGTFSRDLTGAVRFSRSPETCVASSRPLTADGAFNAYARAEIERKYQIQLRERSCNSSYDLSRNELLLLSGPQINAAGAPVQTQILRAIKAKQFSPLLTLTAADFTAAQQKRKDAVSALTERLTRGEDLYALIYTGSPVRSLCMATDDAAQPLADVLKLRQADWSDVLPATPTVRGRADADALFLGLKRGDCTGAVLSADSARKVLEALRRDNVSVELHPASIKGEEIAGRMEEIRQQKLAAAEAAQKAEDARKLAEAERTRCRSKAVAENYFTAVCLAAGTPSSDASLRSVEEERNKLSSCPADLLDDISRTAKQASRQAASKVSSLVVFEEGLAVQCRRIAGSVLP